MRSPFLALVVFVVAAGSVLAASEQLPALVKDAILALVAGAGALKALYTDKPGGGNG